MLALYRESEPIDVLTVSEQLRSTGKLEQAGGKARDRRADRRRPGPRRDPPLRADRARARAHAPPAEHDVRDPGIGPQPRRRAARPRRAGRARDARGRPRRPPEGLPRDRRDPRRRAAQDGEAVARGHVADGHAVGLSGPRRDHRRLPAGQPRSSSQHGRRWENRALVTNIAENAAIDHGQPVALFSPRDVRDRARAALRRLAGRGSRATSCARGACPTQVAEDPRGLGAAGRGAAVRRRLVRRRAARGPRQGAPAAPAAAARA